MANTAIKIAHTTRKRSSETKTEQSHQAMLRFAVQIKHSNLRLNNWSGKEDSNLRPLRPERSALPG